jgi:hypothetical protein
MLQAMPLKTSSQAKTDSERLGASLSSSAKASWPEKSTASVDWSVTRLKAIASPPTTSPAMVVSSTGRRATSRAMTRASSTIANTTTAAQTARASAQRK